MADTYKKISDFSTASQFGDTDLILVSQSGTTRLVTGAMLKAFAKNAGIEAAKINSAAVNASGHLLITTTDGTQIDAGQVNGDDGVSVVGASIDSAYHLILTLSDGQTLDAGYCRGASGAGTGDMQEADYDPAGKVKAAGGIQGYVKATYTAVTLAASSWSSKTYSLENAYPNASYDISVSVAPTATAAQYDAFSKAKICGSTNSNVLTALGTVPTVNIPVIVKAVRK